jgi:hypothetical protein
MIILSFGKWSSSSGRWFVRTRIYFHGHWTPLVRIKIRYPRPKVIVLCGSSRFVDIMAVCAWIIERDENAITMALHLLPRWYFKKEVVKDHLAEHENVREQMDTLHLRKIDLADEIFVVNYEDYIGDSTTNEVRYAQKTGKNIRWFTHDEIGEKVKALLS